MSEFYMLVSMHRSISRVSVLVAFALLLGACSATRQAGSSFSDCEGCPEMVVIPPGRFHMGFEGGEEGRPEGPVRRVRIPRPFALGRFEVTQAEFARFVADTGRVMPGGCRIWDGREWQYPASAGWTNPGYGRLPLDDEPVVCVTWRDARDYARWLAARTGQPYRLPTEAEWEYAARAGTTGDWYWGGAPDAACRHGNVYDRSGERVNGFRWEPFDCDDGYGQVAPVGRFAPNAFGIHDILGNVWEWTADCYVGPYAPDAPVDGSAYEVAGDCGRRTVRGGSWITRPGRQRVSFRGRDPEDARFSFFGFRVARDLP
jgi:formylglycine-generating enzyme required for sulfatase activity